MKIVQMNVTPDMAMEWLTGNTHNRNLSNVAVQVRAHRAWHTQEALGIIIKCWNTYVTSKTLSRPAFKTQELPMPKVR